MIISHKHKFIFIQTWKTAGSGFEIFIRPHLGNNDIITKIESLSDDDNYHNKKCNDPIGLDGKINIYQLKKTAIHYKLITTDQWKKYYKFAFIRNPWDMLVSYHSRLCSNPKKYYGCTIRTMPTFTRWLMQLNICPQLASLQNGEINDAFKYEDLHNSLKFLIKRFNLNVNHNYNNFPVRDWASHRTSYTKNLSNIYNEKMVKYVQKLCSQIIKVGNYQPPECYDDITKLKNLDNYFYSFIKGYIPPKRKKRKDKPKNKLEAVINNL